MARGGYRVGAGRPKGTGKGRTAETLTEARKLPLEYMLDVMNDPEADQVRRDRMAIAAAPFVHARGVEEPAKGKKQQANAAAQGAHQGTEWDADLPTHSVQ